MTPERLAEIRRHDADNAPRLAAQEHRRELLAYVDELKGNLRSAGEALDAYVAASASSNTEISSLRARVAELESERAQLLQLLADLADPDDCRFDHHGGCQAHGYLSLEPGELCPHAEAKQILERHPEIQEAKG